MAGVTVANKYKYSCTFKTIQGNSNSIKIGYVNNRFVYLNRLFDSLFKKLKMDFGQYCYQQRLTVSVV